MSIIHLWCYIYAIAITGECIDYFLGLLLDAKSHWAPLQGPRHPPPWSETGSSLAAPAQGNL